MNKFAKQPWRDDSPISRRDAYTEFLKSKFWRDLRQRKLLLNPLCQIPDCGLCARDAHHVFYRANWEDTQIGDLLSVCGIHHRKIHHIPEPPKPTRRRVIKPTHISKAQQRDLSRRARIKSHAYWRKRRKGGGAYQNLMNRGRL